MVGLSLAEAAGGDPLKEGRVKKVSKKRKRAVTPSFRACRVGVGGGGAEQQFMRQDLKVGEHEALSKKEF